MKVRPLLLACLRIQGEHFGASTPDKDSPLAKRWRALNKSSRIKVPDFFAILGTDGIKRTVPTPHVDLLMTHDWG